MARRHGNQQSASRRQSGRLQGERQGLQVGRVARPVAVVERREHALDEEVEILPLGGVQLVLKIAHVGSPAV